MPNLVNLTVTQAIDQAEAGGFGLRIVGQGEVILAQTPKPGAMVPPWRHFDCAHRRGRRGWRKRLLCPTCRGCTLREAGDLLAMVGLRLNAGQRQAVAQNPPARDQGKGRQHHWSFYTPGND